MEIQKELAQEQVATKRVFKPFGGKKHPIILGKVSPRRASLKQDHESLNNRKKSHKKLEDLPKTETPPIQNPGSQETILFEPPYSPSTPVFSPQEPLSPIKNERNNDIGEYTEEMKIDILKDWFKDLDFKRNHKREFKELMGSNSSDDGNPTVKKTRGSMDTSTTVDDNSVNIMEGTRRTRFSNVHESLTILNTQDMPEIHGDSILEELRQGNTHNLRVAFDKMRSIYNVNGPFALQPCFDKAALAIFSRMIDHATNIPQELDKQKWLEWPLDIVIDTILRLVRVKFRGSEEKPKMEFFQWIESTRLKNFNGTDIYGIERLVRTWEEQLRFIEDPLAGRSDHDRLTFFRQIIDNCIKPKTYEMKNSSTYDFLNKFAKDLRTIVDELKSFEFKDFVDALYGLANKKIDINEMVLNSCMVNSFTKPNSSPESNRLKRQQQSKPLNQQSTHQPKKDKQIYDACYGCGRRHEGGATACKYNNHPDFNHSNLPWLESENGRKWLDKGVNTLPHRDTLAGGQYELSGTRTKPSKPKFKPNSTRKGKDNVTYIEEFNSHENVTTNATLIFRGTSQEVEAFVDNGASLNYIAHSYLNSLFDTNNIDIFPSHTKICSCFDDLHCKQSLGHITCKIKIKQSPIIDPILHFDGRIINFIIVENIHHPIIIGLRSIRRFDLTQILRAQFVEHNTSLMDDIEENHLLYSKDTSLVDNIDNIRSLYEDRNEMERSGYIKSTNKSYEFVEFINEIYQKADLLSLGENSLNDEEINWKEDLCDLLPDLSKDNLSDAKSQNSDLPIIQGDTELHHRVRDIIFKYKDVFSKTVKTVPADITPMHLNVDMNQWMNPRNRGPPRVQSGLRQKAVLDQITKLIQHGVIQESQATEYSQVHLVPKPGESKWRFCIDYRNLNDCSEGMGWPLPNIKLLLDRIGAKRNKWFAVLDLTSGYHQVLLDEESRKLAAFITNFGVYEPLRIPMGLKSAPSFFQQQIAATLSNLIYKICEIYIDDIIIFGKDDEEFIANLENVLARLQSKGITLNPDKARILLDHLEVVGHVISREGITMSEEKIRRVMNFPRPHKEKELKSFLGLTNYFRDHIDNYSKITKPLYDLIHGYTKRSNKIIIWNEQATKAFESIITMIENCPTLYFMDAKAPVFMETDASDYGIGAFLYQLINGEKRAVAFMSKLLSGAQKNWATIEKECFAIYKAIQDWEYLLRDVHFTIRTDHRNLLYLNNTSPKIVRWKMNIQEYDFCVEHISGEENIVADALSRLTLNDCDETDEEYVVEEDMVANISSTINSIRASSKQSTHSLELPLSGAVHHEVNSSTEEISMIHRKILSSVHDHVYGHGGIEITIDRLRANGYEWEGMWKDTRKFIRECPECQKIRDVKNSVKARSFTSAVYKPMNRINIDTIGPLPDAGSNGDKYILVIIDCFSRFIELYPTKSVEAKECSSKLLDFIGRYGVPETILSDRGSQFVNDLIDSLCKLIGTQRQLSIAYSKQENGIVERANREVMRHLRAIIMHKNIVEDWSLCLPLVQRIMNASVHKSIGVSPAQLIFGNSIQLDRNLLPKGEVISTDAPTETTNYLDKLLTKQAEIIAIAQANQLETDEYHLSKSDPSKLTSFPVNSFVLCNYPGVMGGKPRAPTKLHTQWEGPFRVISHIGDEYLIHDASSDTSRKVHVTRLKAFHYDPKFTNPIEVASSDRQLYVVDKVLGHQGNPKRPNSMRFKIHWFGYPDEDDSWEPWTNPPPDNKFGMKDSEKVHEYLKSIGLERIIPQKYKR